jgi:hypothetical protein
MLVCRLAVGPGSKAAELVDDLLAEVSSNNLRIRNIHFSFAPMGIMKRIVLAVAIALFAVLPTTSANAASTTRNVIGSNYQAGHSKCTNLVGLGNEIQLLVNHVYTVKYDAVALTAPQLSKVAFKGLTSNALCGLAVNSFWVNQKQVTTAANTKINCLKSSFPRSTLTAAQWKKIANKPLCSSIYTQFSYYRIYSFMLTASITTEVISIGLPSGWLQGEGAIAGLLTSINPYGETAVRGAQG